METKIFNCKFYDTECTFLITYEYPNILEVKNNLTYLLRKKHNELKSDDQEFITQYKQGKSNNKTYKEYEDKKGKYIKYQTGTSIKPSFIKIYKD